jgi:hypothetical protein
MDGLSLARTLHRLAREDTNSENVGRIIVSEAQNLLLSPTLNGQQIIDLLKQHYPHSGYTYDLRTPNVLLIYFDGKQHVKNRRINSNPYLTIGHQKRFTMQADHSGEFYAEKHQDPEEHHAPKPDSQGVIW